MKREALKVYIETPSRRFTKGKKQGKIDVLGRIMSEANQREHWRSVHKRQSMQKMLVKQALYRKPKPKPPVHVILTRSGKTFIKDDDNLARGFKSVRDFVSRWLGVDDGDTENITFEYKQVKESKYGFYIEVKGEW